MHKVKRIILAQLPLRPQLKHHNKQIGRLKLQGKSTDKPHPAREGGIERSRASRCFDAITDKSGSSEGSE
jgi:hypothetical protein